MDECEAMAGDYLNLFPRRTNPELFSQDLLTDPSMAHLVEKDSTLRNAIAAETPSEVIGYLMPSDGHLE